MSGKRVCFVQPPSSLLLEDKVMVPLGILYLAAWLRKHGHEPSIVDLAGVNNWQEVIRDKKIEDADWIGITATTPQYHVAKEITAQIKTAYGQDKKVIVGGIHTTSLVHAQRLDFLSKDGFDSYVIGEGYGSVLSICKDLSGDHSSTGGSLKTVYQEPILKDVNDLPFAARDLIDIHSYKYKLGDVLTTTQYTQYGCPYACQYCESPMAGSWTVRAMHPQRVAAEVKQCIDDFGIYGHMFFDDEMNLSKSRLLGICDRLKEIEGVLWRGFFVSAKFDREVAEACRASGCFEVASGIESGSDTILRNIRKPATRRINRDFIVTAKRAGLRVKGFFIVGLPGETWETIRETDRFLQELKDVGCAPDDVDFSILQVYPGAPIYQRPQDIEFDSAYEKSYYKSAPGAYEDLVQVRTKEMSKTDLLQARNWLENRWKPEGWTDKHTDRKDLDQVYESIRIAEKKVGKS
jgi:anaerobic magnesium-protoporphyrin IX monomethyl ester cyclase